jgi:hypothetical protein
MAHLAVMDSHSHGLVPPIPKNSSASLPGWNLQALWRFRTANQAETGHLTVYGFEQNLEPSRQEKPEQHEGRCIEKDGPNHQCWIQKGSFLYKSSVL